MSSFQASSSTAAAGVDWVPLDNVAVCFQSKEDEVSSTSSSHDVALRMDLDDEEDEVSSISSSLYSSSPTRYDKFEPMPYQDDLHKIGKLIDRGFDECGDDLHNIDLFKLTGFTVGERPIRAGPLLQVFSVTISNESNPLWEDLEISGEISITDGLNNTFYIYKCEEDKPQLVSTECNRLILKRCPITPVYTGEKVKFSLKDKKSGEIFFDGKYDVDFSIKDAYASKEKEIIKYPGKDGFYASMEYIKIPFASVAMVSMFIEDRFEGRGGCFDIHGTIKANDLVLFEKQYSEPANMKHGLKNPFVQYTRALAVPVYSLLAVEIKLYSGDDEVADDEFEVSPYGLHVVSLSNVCKDESYVIWMYVTWFLHQDYFEERRLVDNVNVKWNPTLPWDQMEDLEPPSDVKSKRALVEVFSVFVGGKSSAPLDLCGKIVVRDVDRDNTVFIFARNSEIPDALTDEQWRTVSLAWSDRWFVEKDFYMYLNLKDKYGKRVCRGHLYWCPKEDIGEQQYDRRFCEVIRGANGYFAAVHYSVFKNGKKARVTVTWEGDYATVVYGVVYASYSNHKYPSTYDEQYYRSIIFKRSEKDGVSVEKYSEIPLSKSHVSAPSVCEGLCVDVKLYYEETYDNQFGVEGFSSRRYSEKFEFKANETEVKSSECFSVKVEWPSNGSE